MIMIDSDGEAIPVHGRCFRFPIANIRNQSLADIWKHPRAGRDEAHAPPRGWPASGLQPLLQRVRRRCSQKRGGGVKAWRDGRERGRRTLGFAPAYKSERGEAGRESGDRAGRNRDMKRAEQIAP